MVWGNCKPALQFELLTSGRKSQLAIEYAWRIRAQSPNIWVFWIHASNVARFEESYRAIADIVRLPGRENPKANIFKLVYDWLCNNKRQWRLILDNLDDAHFLFDMDIHSTQSSKPLREYLPQRENGSVLITTRTTKAALQLVERSEIIFLSPMSEAEAFALLQKKLDKQDHGEGISELAAALEFMPLAIIQAAAYISQRTPYCSVKQYLEQFQKSDDEKTSLLDMEAGQLRRDHEAKNSIIITWHISFNHIRKTRPSATKILSLISMFDRQGIPEYLVRNGIENKGPCEDQQTQESGIDIEPCNGFEDDVHILKAYSFLSTTREQSTEQIAFEMHALVQLATRKWLKMNGQLERLRQDFVRILNEEFPTGKFEHWKTCQMLFPHAKCSIEQRPESQDGLKDWASLLYKASWYAVSKGSLRDAQKLALYSMEVRTKLFGEEDKDTLSSMAMAGISYCYGGQLKKAEDLQIQVVETRKRVLGPEHPDTLITIANLALTYKNQGRWKEAEKLEIDTVETGSRILGEDYPDILACMDSLALSYNNQGRWKKAEELTLRVIETRQKVLGETHIDTITSMATLAAIYNNQSRWKEAEELFVKVIETRKRELGQEHPETLSSMANLALNYNNQGCWRKAEELFIRVMETSSKVLGPEHSHTLTSMGNLALTYDNQKRWKEAEELNMRVFTARKRVLGPEHPHTLTSMNNLAFTWENMGQDTKAIGLMEECFRLRERILGSNHPDTVSSSAALATWKKKVGGQSLKSSWYHKLPFRK